MKWLRVSIVALAAVALASCSTLTETKYPGESRNLGVPGEVIAVTEGVEYYPACSNETLAFDGLLYFPFTPSNADEFPYEAGFFAPTVDTDETAQALGGASNASGFGGGLARNVPFVAAPGPGDDVGTLTQYENGFAYWISDSGYLSTWLTNQKLTYNWVC